MINRKQSLTSTQIIKLKTRTDNQPTPKGTAMKMILLTLIIVSFMTAPLFAQEYPELKDLKRPRYGFFEQNEKSVAEQKSNRAATQTEEQKNSRFAGKFKGSVTVHYKGRMIKTEAELTIAVNATAENSHYDFYILPPKGEYLENSWMLDRKEVRRSVTIADRTIYITDIIAYENKGGNSQIRTLVFSPDYSALTFLKTEFDDSVRETATGQIIGRFTRVKQHESKQ